MRDCLMLSSSLWFSLGGQQLIGGKKVQKILNQFTFSMKNCPKIFYSNKLFSPSVLSFSMFFNFLFLTIHIQFNLHATWSNECDDEMPLESCTAHQILPTNFCILFIFIVSCTQFNCMWKICRNSWVINFNDLYLNSI